MENFAENKENYEKLFLFEFLVDHVCVYNSKLNLDKQIVSVLGPVAVRFQFLNYPPIEVCEESFATSTKPLMEEKTIYMKSGKSCMFSLSALKSQTLLNKETFNVYLTVYRYKLQARGPACPPEKLEDVFIGRTVLNLGDVFKDLFTKCKQGSQRLTHTKTSVNMLADCDGNIVGKIMFLIRVSCFGFMVMTGFQLPEEEQKDFMYKNIVYDAPAEKGEAMTPSTDLVGKPDSKTCSLPCGPSGDKEPDKEKDKDKNKEKKKKKKKIQSQNDKKKEGSDFDVCNSPPSGCPPCPCACRMGQAQGFPMPFPVQMAGQTMSSLGPYGGLQSAPSVSSTQAPGPNRATNMNIDPGSVGIRGNQLVFKMPDKQAKPQAPVEGKFASSVYYKMDDDNQNGARNVIQILPQNPIGEVDKSKVDEKQDVLVLKLGKKRLAAGKKPKLELELRTPKMKEEKPPREEKDTQYLESDIPKPPKSGKSGKSKKGDKGKKGGKGKKK